MPGRRHDLPVGPYPAAMGKVGFPRGLFATLVSFLAPHREGLSVLVHPDTGRQKADHAHQAIWMGAVLPLDTTVLPD
jgi:aromatic ring-cleaving dioxygenase